MDYNLKLFRILLDKKPLNFDSSVQEKAEAEFARASEEKLSEEELDQIMIDYGKHAWPYWQAEFEMIEKNEEGGGEEGLFLSHLSSELRVKWQEFEKS